MAPFMNSVPPPIVRVPPPGAPPPGARMLLVAGNKPVVAGLPVGFAATAAKFNSSVPPSMVVPPM